jgi:hypothetical protein
MPIHAVCRLIGYAFQANSTKVYMSRRHRTAVKEKFAALEKLKERKNES